MRWSPFLRLGTIRSVPMPLVLLPGPMTAVTADALVTLHDIEAAARGLDGVAVRTPLLRVESLSSQFPDGVWVKPEMLQRTGAFKFRGAYTYLTGHVPG